MALIIVLSVFNGFDNVIRMHFNAFDPDIKITSILGKTFVPDSSKLAALSNCKEIKAFSKTIEENVLITYSEKQHIATIKGVDDNYLATNSLDTMMQEGEFLLKKGNQNYAVIGQGIAYYLQVGLQFMHPLKVFVLRKNATITFNPQSAVSQG
jgi:lipoprotein-releasing system permease protein